MEELSSFIGVQEKWLDGWLSALGWTRQSLEVVSSYFFHSLFFHSFYLFIFLAVGRGPFSSMSFQLSPLCERILAGRPRDKVLKVLVFEYRH